MSLSKQAAKKAAPHITEPYGHLKSQKIRNAFPISRTDFRDK